ncbi:MAG: DUF177 domain-containing protein [Aliidongia sp.]
MTDILKLGPEFSRPVSTAKLSKEPATYRLTATDVERAALVQRFGLVSLDRLEAEVRLQRAAGDVRLEADLSADLVQACIVTLEPVPAKIAESFVLIFRPGIDEDEADRLALENPEDEIIEPLMGESIDIGEAVAQQLSVAMDPYPRVSGAQSAGADIEFGEAPDAPSETSIARRNPFDVLATLKRQP